MARGDYVTVLDSDDEFLPSFVERSSEILTSDSSVDFVYTDYYERFPDGKQKVVKTGADVMKTVKVGMMHRADHLRQVGLYDPDLSFAEYDLLM